MSAANANPLARFHALLVECDSSIEDYLRQHDCSVARAAAQDLNQDLIDGVDLMVIGDQALTNEATFELVKRVVPNTSTLVITAREELAVHVVRLGASVVMGQALELVTAQLGHLLELVDLKRRVARSLPPPSGVVQRRSTPLPKQAVVDALDGLVEAAEDLLPMHVFQRVYVDYALRRFCGNKVHTAAALGIDRRTIQRWARASVVDGAPASSGASEMSVAS